MKIEVLNHASIKLTNDKVIYFDPYDIDKEYHDAVRGEGAFEKLDKNARIYAEKNGAGRLGANIAINKINRDSVADTLRYVKDSPFISSIAVNFHTPYPGTEEVMLSHEEKCKVIDEVIALKKQHYPIQNSISGLKMMKVRGFKNTVRIVCVLLTCVC